MSSTSLLLHQLNQQEQLSSSTIAPSSASISPQIASSLRIFINREASPFFLVINKEKCLLPRPSVLVEEEKNPIISISPLKWCLAAKQSRELCSTEKGVAVEGFGDFRLVEVHLMWFPCKEVAWSVGNADRASFFVFFTLCCGGAAARPFVHGCETERLSRVGLSGSDIGVMNQ
ncbi:hypothetical protein Taro_043139 [Colocasia esculenta]|uniref:Uncharacterized protein n=1 Tax=Colocasia esculenta TaxID=4460 RepID=A0A843X3N7_COLES|nr:hypothetical protein [Colocasia esculenta]